MKLQKKGKSRHLEKQKIHISEPMFMQTVINRKKSSRPKVGTDTQRTDAQQSLVGSFAVVQRPEGIISQEAPANKLKLWTFHFSMKYYSINQRLRGARIQACAG